jgi:hypothetical protein
MNSSLQYQIYVGFFPVRICCFVYYIIQNTPPYINFLDLVKGHVQYGFLCLGMLVTEYILIKVEFNYPITKTA